MKILKLTFLFLFINFGSLALGNLLMENGPQSDWYQSLNQAPWTPPGWVFGAAWTTIMICFSIFMALVFEKWKIKQLKILFTLQVILNISWNYAFFNQQWTKVGLIIIALLTFVIFYFLIKYQKKLKLKNLLIYPYAIWLIIATSLNLYIVLNN